MPANYTAEEAVDAIVKLIKKTHFVSFTGFPKGLRYTGPDLTHCSVTAKTSLLSESLTTKRIAEIDCEPLVFLVMKAYQLGFNQCAELRDDEDRRLGRDDKIDEALAFLARTTDANDANS